MTNTMLVSAGGAPSTRRMSGRARQKGPEVVEPLPGSSREVYESVVRLLGMRDGKEHEISWHKTGHALKGTTWGRRVLDELKGNYNAVAPYLAAELAQVVPEATYQGANGPWKPDVQMQGDLEKVVNYIQVGIRG